MDDAVQIRAEWDKKRGEGKEEYQENGAKRKRQTTGDTNKCVNINWGYQGRRKQGDEAVWQIMFQLRDLIRYLEAKAEITTFPSDSFHQTTSPSKSFHQSNLPITLREKVPSPPHPISTCKDTLWSVYWRVGHWSSAAAGLSPYCWVPFKSSALLCYVYKG